MDAPSPYEPAALNNQSAERIGKFIQSLNDSFRLSYRFLPATVSLRLGHCCQLATPHRQRLLAAYVFCKPHAIFTVSSGRRSGPPLAKSW